MTDIYEDGAAGANEHRASWALAAVETFGQETRQTLDIPAGDLMKDTDLLIEVTTDLIADLLHLLRAAGRDEDAMEAIVTAAFGHFAFEVQEELDEDDEPDDPSAMVVVTTPDAPTPMPVRALYELAA